MKIVWTIIAVIYFVMTAISFFLAYKSRKKQNLDEIKLNELPTEPYEPKKNTGFFVSTTTTNRGSKSEIRSQVFVDIVGHFNKQINKFQAYINKATLPKLQEYIDNTSKVNMTGFIVAGIVSLIGTITAILSLFLTFEGG
jgi:uncharacterized BrkB/YihY/UPF0761 family membrane protein